MSERIKSFTAIRDTYRVAKNVALSRNYAHDVDPHEYESYVLKYGREKLGQKVADLMKKYGPSVDENGNKPNILDIGAGTGLISKALLDSGYSVTSTDLSLPSLNLIPEKGKEIDIVLSDMNEDFPFHDNSFDGITSVWANRFITDSDHFLSESLRVLRPNGILLWPIFPPERIPWKINNGMKQHTTTKALATDATHVGFSESFTIPPDYIGTIIKRDLPLRAVSGFVIARK